MYYKVTFRPPPKKRGTERVKFNWWAYVHTEIYNKMNHQRGLGLEPDHKHRLVVLQKLFTRKVVDWEMVEDEEAENHARLSGAKIYRKPTAEVQPNSARVCEDARLAGIRLRFVQENERRAAAGSSGGPLPSDRED